MYMIRLFTAPSIARGSGVIPEHWPKRVSGVKGVLVPAACRPLAGIAVLGGILAAVEVASYEQRGALRPEHLASAPPAPGPPASWYYWATPWWAYALAVVVG